MRTSFFVAALIAAGCSTAAISAEVKKDTKTPVVKAQKMSDSDMDKVTAGGGTYIPGDSASPNGCCSASGSAGGSIGGGGVYLQTLTRTVSHGGGL